MPCDKCLPTFKSSESTVTGGTQINQFLFGNEADLDAGCPVMKKQALCQNG